jgi:hypothetical protein
MRKILFSFLFLLSFILETHAQAIKEIEPSWVTNTNYSDSEINKNDISEGTHLLLFDTQINIPKKSIYYRYSTKITDNVGIQNASTINVSYDPTYQKLKFHKINIIRGNEVIDKLNIANIQVMRRELNAENFLYDGSLSAVMNISDVRTDDIIDYSYTITGFNPIHKNIFSGYFYLNDIESAGKINVTLLSEKEVTYKLFNTQVKPKMSKENNLYKYNWVNTNTKKLDYEENTPSWKLLYESVSISEYNSWKDIVNWGLDVYKVTEKTHPELQAKIDEINSKNETEGEKIKSTLDFVQNEIRYLGLESGIGSYKPFSPNQVFNQRFGDCKDKSLLMVTMLNQMGIEAYPMLVNTYLKQTIKELLPSQKVFDHCVVKVITGKRSYYYDPTFANQGGYYDSTHFPNYAYGLSIEKGNGSFDEITPYSENKIETLEEFTINEVGKGAILKVVTTYHEAEADNMRNYFKSNSVNAIEKEFEKFYSNYYYNVSSTKTPYFEDKLNVNLFKVYEEYKLDSIWEPMLEKKDYISATFTSTNLQNALYIPNKDKRSAEIAVVYPIIREHQIKIKLPEDWILENDKLFVSSPGFYYEWKVDYNKAQKTINLNYYLKTQKDHINQKEFKQYIQDVKQVEQTSSYIIYMPKNYTATNFTDNSTNLFNGLVNIFKFLLGLGFIVVLALLAFFYFGKKKAK